VNLGGDILLQRAIGKKAGIQGRILAFLVNVLLSAAGYQGGWEGGARGLCAGSRDDADEQREPAMSDDRHDRPKCKARMENGFIADYTNGHANRVQAGGFKAIRYAACGWD
jgi:hypothetical protein